jgi:hypothetical protein
VTILQREENLADRAAAEAVAETGALGGADGYDRL